MRRQLNLGFVTVRGTPVKNPAQSEHGFLGHAACLPVPTGPQQWHVAGLESYTGS